MVGAPRVVRPDWRKDWRLRAVAAVALIALGAAGASLFLLRRGAVVSGLGMWVQLDLDVGDEVSQLAISNDGAQIVFAKGNQLLLRRLDQAKFVSLAGTEG